MKNKTFEELLNINCFSENRMEQREADENQKKQLLHNGGAAKIS